MSDFEERLKRLEELSDSIQKNDITLEDALKCYEEGVRLAKSMEKTLSEAEGRVEILMNGGEIVENEKERQLSESSTKKNEDVPPELGLFDEASEVTGTRA